MEGVIRKKGKRILPTLAVWIGLGLIAVAPVWANPCAKCSTPTAAAIAANYPLSLDVRSHWFWGNNKDYLCVDAGACTTTVKGLRVSMENWRLEEKAKGAVQTCPHLTSADSFTVSISSSDSTAWSLSGSASASATLLGTGVTATIGGSLDSATGHTRAKSLTKKLAAGYCAIIYWSVFLEKADPVAHVTVDISQSWAWWTKNASTGSTVHQKGVYVQDCGSVDLKYTCTFPLSLYLHTCQDACPDPECRSTARGEIGFTPPLPPGLDPPEGWKSPLDSPIVWPDGDEDDATAPLNDE